MACKDDSGGAAAAADPSFEGEEDDGMPEDLLAAARLEVTENALDIEGPIVERVNSGSFKWVLDAFEHAQAFVDAQGKRGDGVSAAAAGAAAAEGAGDDGATEADAKPDSPAAKAEGGESVVPPEAAAAAAAGGDDDLGEGESEDDEEEPSRFPSRTASGARSPSPGSTVLSGASGDEWQAGTTAWVLEAILKRRRAKGVTMWLIKWKYVVEPTWEAEDELVDEGHGKMLEEFVAKQQASAARPKPKRKERPARKDGDDALTPMGGVFDPCVFWDDFYGKVAGAFNRCNLRVDRIELCCPRPAAASLMRMWREMLDDGGRAAPAMLFHGTSDFNWFSIATRGFFIPGKGGVRVVNGSAYGVGVYTASQPSVSCSYVRGTQAMFVCAGLVRDKFATSVRHAGNIVVFFNQAQVLPCALVFYHYGSGKHQQPIKDFVVGSATNIKQQLRKLQDQVVMSKSADAAARYARAAQFVGDPDESLEQSIIKRTGGKATKKTLKQLPAAAKALYKEGKLAAPKSDRSKR